MDTEKMRRCAPLLPPPGDAVVVECLDTVERLRKFASVLLDDLQHRISDRADSSLPEWEEEARRLGCVCVEVTPNAERRSSGLSEAEFSGLTCSTPVSRGMALCGGPIRDDDIEIVEVPFLSNKGEGQ